MAEDRERQVRERAYALWEQEGRPQGKHDAHWAQADSEFGKTGPEGLVDVGIADGETAAPAVPRKPRAPRKPKA